MVHKLLLPLMSPGAAQRSAVAFEITPEALQWSNHFLYGSGKNNAITRSVLDRSDASSKQFRGIYLTSLAKCHGGECISPNVIFCCSARKTRTVAHDV